MLRRELLCCGMLAVVGVGITIQGREENKKDSLCGVRENQADAGPLNKSPKWGKENIRYLIMGRDDDLEREVWDKQFSMAFDSWSEVTPLTFSPVGRSEEYDILISVSGRKREKFGHRGGVLAWAQLPPYYNFDGVLISKFDTAENWVLPDSKMKGTILLSVATHEIGHLLGLDHSSDPTSLMFPYINNSLKPQEEDISRIQKLYGKPK